MGATTDTGWQIDRYVLERRLGQGGMASVYLARHADLGTQHAIKLLTVHSNTLADRMLQEGRIQARLRHPNIVAVTDIVRFDGEIGLVMDYVDGVSLGGLIGHVDLSHDAIDAIAQGLFAGVEAAHQLQLVHRDLKPDNVLLALSGDALKPRIADFGLAKAIRDELRVGRSTRMGSSMGTPQYMAPEQYRDASAVDPRADLFSLGAILYELVSGEPVFPNEDLPVLLARVQMGHWTPLHERVPDAPPAWVAAIHACLALSPDDRPASIAEVRALWGPPRTAANPWTPDVLDHVRRLRDRPAPDPVASFHTPLPTARRASTPVPTRSRWSAVGTGIAALGLGGMTFGGGAVLGIGLLAALALAVPTAPPVATPSTPPIEIAPDEASLRPTRREASAREPSRVRPTAASPAPAPGPLASPVPDAVPTPAPEPTAPAPDPTLATVSLPGLDGYLVDSAGKRHPLRLVAAGTYDVFVFFDTRVATLATQVTLQPGQSRALKCDSVSRICR
ncbi:MAG: serine/threonine protein kinase [Alphaproteobacteria bacterium]|nr:serine/threonine protein kinase [Alphaproteobacteria bacterium]